MGRTTDMERIKSKAKAFLYTDIAETRIPFVASHPFTNTWHTYLPKEGERFGEMIDLHDEEKAKLWRSFMEQSIDEANLLRLFMLMNKPYILTFIKFTQRFLSDEDLGFVLGNFWTEIEQISLDDNITGKDIVEWFTRAAKDKLMDEEERELFNSLPEEVTVYRGVTDHNKSRHKAFSWSTDRKVAEWFADRFQTGTGQIWTLTVPKDRILCCFEGRNEHEVIVNLYGFSKKPIVDKL